MPSIVYVLMGVVIGAVLGWAIGFVKGRKSAPLVGADNRLEEDLKQRLDARERELADARQQATRVCVELAKAESERDASHLLLEKAQALHEKTLAEARLAQDKALVDLREAFKALSADALKQTQPQFLALANETLAKFQETAKGDLGKRQEAIAALVQPLKEQLESYQRRLQQSDTAQASTLGEVKKQLESLAQNSQTLSSETLQLRKVLSSNQARGRWGEETLRNVVEAAGMSAHCDFTEQDQSGDSKPDLTIRLPGNRIIIVDAKVPDLDFLSAMDSADELKRNDALSAHAAKLKATIKALADRDYPRQFQNALDYVVLFLPAES
ncbi:MAG: DNA recombination protein RmuC, partial [Limisphaerales bacterium]